MEGNDGFSGMEAPSKYKELERSLRRLAAWIKAEGRKVIKEGNYKITPAQFDVLQRLSLINI